jgi:DNA-binding PadR family transcriptional regulator
MSKENRPPDSYLPLKTAWLHVLLAVSGGHHHGYAIRQEVEERTEGKVRLWPATLYGTLSQLTEAGLLVEADAPPEGVGDDDPRRRYYRLTPPGERVLDAELRRMEALVHYARSRRVARDASGA